MPNPVGRPPAPTTELGSVPGLWGGGVSSRWGGGRWANVYAYDDPPELTWPTSVAVYDRMRRSSGQVSAILRSVTLPIISARWELDPAGARDEVVAAVAEDMGLPIMGVGELDRAGERSRFSWTEHLRQALTYLTYGHSVFELVALHIDGKLRLRKIAPRPATTIAAWNVADDGGLISVDQHSRGGGVVTIPSSRLVVYSHDMSPGEWQGCSLLRPSYGVWTLKERALRVWAMVIERNGLGIPRATAPPDATESQIAALDQMTQAWRAGENSAATIPHGSAVDLVGVTGSLPDIEAHVRYCDVAIAKSVLAQAMELGTSTEGSRALSTSWIDFFKLSLQAMMRELADVANNHIVADVVEWNWGPDEPAPRIRPAETSLEQAVAPADLARLIQVGAIAVDDTTERWLRTRSQMPERDGSEPRPLQTLTPPSDDSSPKALAEIVQKIYLGVGVVLTASEARAILNRAGAGLDPKETSETSEISEN